MRPSRGRIPRQKANKEDVILDITDPKIDWQIPNQETFEKFMDLAICDFTDDNPDRLEVIKFSKVGWNMGVGLVGFRTDTWPTQNKNFEVLNQ